MDAPFTSPIELLASPWTKDFYDLVESVEEELLVASPYLSKRPLEKIAEIIRNKQPYKSVHISILTNLAVDSLLSGSLDVAAVLHLVQAIPNCTIAYLPGLHAKIYVADNKAAVITSANLTNRGLSGNHEYGVLLRDSVLISKVRSDLSQYASLGNTVSLDTLMALSTAAEDLKSISRQIDRSMTAKLKRMFEQRTETVQLELLTARAQGKTTHGIFSDTIIYLLEHKGPLTTVDMHPLIQQIHPDLCDDLVDRVIGDVHFGKKWKHYVRNAQQSLKRQGLISLVGEQWVRRS